MISNCGCEDCCGVLWQISSEICDSGATWFNSLDANKILCNNDTFYTNSKQLQGRLGAREESVWELARTVNGAYSTSYNSSGRGTIHAGLVRRYILGGCYGNGNTIGSRSARVDVISSCYAPQHGTRLVALSYVG